MAGLAYPKSNTPKPQNTYRSLLPHLILLLYCTLVVTMMVIPLQDRLLEVCSNSITALTHTPPVWFQVKDALCGGQLNVVQLIDELIN